MKKGLLVLVLSLFGMIVLNAQQSLLKGKVLDNTTKEPISYANISLTSYADSSFLSGAISNEKGTFKIEDYQPGKYKLKVSFIGYQLFSIDSLELNEGTSDIGNVELEVFTENLHEIDVKAEKQGVNYTVDRKVIDAGSFPDADVAMDLLENVTSLEVDFDGNLTYRGDGTFKVYINGRPTTNGENKLRQLPTSQIDKIEVITNPSARYDSEGTAGIIHVILKKNKLEGYAISASAKIGTRMSADLNFSIDKKGKKGGWYINGNVGSYVWGESSIEQHQVIESDSNIYENNIYRHLKYGGVSEYLEVGFNLDLSDKDYLDFSAHINPFKQTEFQYSDGNYSELTYDLDNKLEESLYYTNESRNDLFYQFAGASLSYEHAFNKKRTHLLAAYVTFSTYLRNFEEKLIETKDYTSYIERSGYVAGESNETTFDSEITYSVPFSEIVGLEAGGKISTDHIPEITSTSGTFDDQGNLTPFPEEPINQQVVFTQDIYAGFITLKSEWEKFAFKLGGRVEYTDRISDYKYQDVNGNDVVEPGRTDFTDFFPTAHFTFNLTKDNQLTLSYSRRIERPRYWKLVPLKQYYSPFAYSTGNADLLPSYSDAFELGYKKSWAKDFVGFELFARKTSQVMQTYTRTDTLNILFYKPENVGNSTSIGAELMAGVDLWPWWNVNFSSSFFFYQLDVDVDYDITTKDQFRVNARLNNTFNLPLAFTFKWDVRYNSPRVTAQAEYDGYIYSNVAMKKGFNDNSWNLTLAFSNLFTGVRYYSVSQGDGFEVETTTVNEPYATIKVAYLFNKQE